MKINRIKISNFRSLRRVELCPSAFNVFVGQNNHGKSNLFDAIEWFYTGKGDLGDIKHCDAEEHEHVEVEIEFAGVQAGISHISNEVNQEKLRRVVATSDFMHVKRSSNNSKDRLLLDSQTGEWKKTITGADATFNNCIPRFEFIDATKNFKDVSAYKNSTPIGQMLSSLVAEILEKDDDYQLFNEQFERLFGHGDSKVRQALNSLSDKVTSYLKEQFPDCMSINFTVNSPSIDDFLKNYDTELNDGVVTKANDKGDGMQRALMLSIIKAHADFRRGDALGRAFIFFIDEAELHLHPTGQRQLKKSLLELTRDIGCDQVFITTHSSVLIADGDKDDNQSFFRVLKDNKCTSIEEINRNAKQSVVYDLLGGSPADLLLPANFLIVEGASEVEFYSHIVKRFYQDKPEIQLLPANGDDDAQRQTMNGLNRVFFPLKSNSIYKNKLIILFDKPDDSKKSRFDKFKRENGFLERNKQLYVLPVNGIEDYYPMELHDNCPVTDKVKKAKWIARNISQLQFEETMNIIDIIPKFQLIDG